MSGVALFAARGISELLKLYRWRLLRKMTRMYQDGPPGGGAVMVTIHANSLNHALNLATANGETERVRGLPKH